MKAIGKGEGMHDICNLFGAALSRARRELGLTQIELAEKLGTTDRSISDLERGKTNPKLDTVAHFSRSLGISIGAKGRCSILRQDVLCRDERRGSG